MLLDFFRDDRSICFEDDDIRCALEVGSAKM